MDEPVVADSKDTEAPESLELVRAPPEMPETFGGGGRGRYLVKCGCGVEFKRWVAPEDAEEDLLRSVLLAFEN